MPKRVDLHSILILGAGPIIIGQACEFDYSGVQACKALKEEGYRIILVNSNPASIMTDPGFSDVTYIEPLHWEEIAKIIEIERPDALLPTMGGQTALNCTMELIKQGVLKEFNVELIGASHTAIEKAENRGAFRSAMERIGLDVPKAKIAESLEEAKQFQKTLGFPIVIRPSFTLGGSGGGIARNEAELIEICRKGLALSPINSVLIEESLLGWKEFETEVVRDKKDNCIIVCTIENIDPMGIHTGDSITVAPAQTLTDKEYQRMRNASIAILREIGVETGGANVQFAVHPLTGRLVVIEMNPRVSRSSALASKATGFPIAKVAAKLAVGYTLDELRNETTKGNVPCSFEPTLDYVVTKIPRFNFDKFPGSSLELTTQMKSVGEVMALGRTFQESLQKALSGLEMRVSGLNSKLCDMNYEALKKITEVLKTQRFDRLFYIADAFRYNMSIDEVYELTCIDPWFLAQIQDLINTEKEIIQNRHSDITEDLLRIWKRKGFSDKRIADLLIKTETDIRNLRREIKVMPVFKRVDSCAAEFQAKTAYFYSSYESYCEAEPSTKQKIIVLGSGPNRIGQGIEFDYCCVHAVMALREAGFETIMVNCNPETVSTDYDMSDRLYFEPLTFEHVLSIIEVEKPYGVVVHYGGQTPLKLVRDLVASGIKIIGTQPDAIDCAEDRKRFKKLISDLGLKQACNETARTIEEGIKFAERLKYPILVRPSYVLGGQAMRVMYSTDELQRYFSEAVEVSHECPVILDKFLQNAIEVDVDAICDGKEVFVGGILEHIEPAGIHSGDSTCSLPAHSLSSEIQARLFEQTRILALALQVVGPFNVQFAIQNNEIYVIEVNPRVSRTVPFVSKAIGIPMAKIAALCMIGKSLKEQNILGSYQPPYFSVKRSVFVFEKFPGTQNDLGPEMKSTGEVMGVGDTFEEALGKALKGAGIKTDAQQKQSLQVRSLQALHSEVKIKNKLSEKEISKTESEAVLS